MRIGRGTCISSLSGDREPTNKALPQKLVDNGIGRSMNGSSNIMFAAGRGANGNGNGKGSIGRGTNGNGTGSSGIGRGSNSNGRGINSNGNGNGSGSSGGTESRNSQPQFMENYRNSSPVNSTLGPLAENVNEDHPNHAESQPLKKKTRGITMGVDAPEEGESKILVVVLNNTLTPIQARTKINPLFRNNFNEFIPKWNGWKDKLDLLWGEYLRYFRFESPEEQAKGRIVWESIAAENYPKYLHLWKARALRKYKSLAIARNHPPEWTTPSVWKQLCDYWMGFEFQKSSELRKRNRSSRNGIPHASGNTTFQERRLKLWKKLGRAPTQWELFNETHMTKRKGSNEKEFITEGAENFSKTYAKKLRVANGLEPTAPVNGVDDPDLKIYEEAVGGVKKGKLAGRPKERWSKRSGNVSSSDFITQVALQQSSQEVKKLKEDLAESERKRAESERKHAESERRHEKNNSIQNAYLQSMFQYMEAQAAKRGDPPPPPTFDLYPTSEGASNTHRDNSLSNLGDDQMGGMDDDVGGMDDDVGRMDDDAGGMDDYLNGEEYGDYI